MNRIHRPCVRGIELYTTKSLSCETIESGTGSVSDSLYLLLIVTTASTYKEAGQCIDLQLVYILAIYALPNMVLY